MVFAGMDTPKYGETHKQVQADKRHPRHRITAGGYCHIWAIEVCAAVKGMVFKQFTLA